jgi:hypothetical protein
MEGSGIISCQVALDCKAFVRTLVGMPLHMISHNNYTPTIFLVISAVPALFIGCGK